MLVLGVILLIGLVGVVSAQNATCTDSDDGDNYYIKGTVNNALGVITSDLCINNTMLNEHSCPENSSQGTKVTAYNCPSGCSDGACICVDSDNGDDYYIKGTVNNALGVTTQDSCVNSTLLNEHSCPENSSQGTKVTAYNCPSGCENGACKYICTDSDGGINYFKRGTMMESVGSSSNSATDNCISERILSEYYCPTPGVNDANSLTYTCQVACENGACINQTSSINNTFCTDSDGGIDYYTKGYVSTNYNEQNPNYYAYDSCMIPDMKVNNGLTQRIGVSSCEGSDCSVQDFYCEGSTGPYSSGTKCPNGCKDGACIKGEKITEQVRCEFEGSNKLQKCYTTDSRADCSGKESCIANITGYFGEYITWKSTCGGIDHSAIGGPANTNAPNGIQSVLFHCAPGPGVNESEIKDKGFKFAYWECYNGENQKGTEADFSVCKSSEAWKKLASEFCKGKCNSAGKCGVNSFGITDECYGAETTGGGGEEIFGEDTLICKDSCPLDNKCYPFGYRKKGNYCSDDGQFIVQKEGDETCDNNFECDSNFCVNDVCASRNFIQKIIDFFRNLFGAE